MFQIHPSVTLRELFKKKPYQGAHPHDAKFLFVGLDANYAEDIEQQVIFDKVKEYHEDGVKFWLTHGVHHPFLLSAYPGRGAGRFYHANFAKIGFLPENARDISFVELLNVPTIGKSKLLPEELNPEHLEWLYKLVFEGKAENIFMGDAVIRLLQQNKSFSKKIKSNPKVNEKGLVSIYKGEDRQIYKNVHFSYQWNHTLLSQSLESIGALIK